MAEPFDVNNFISQSTQLGSQLPTGSVASQTAGIERVLAGQNKNDAAAAGALAADQVAQAKAVKEQELTASLVLSQRDQQFRLDTAAVYEGAERNKQEQFRISSELENLAVERERLKAEAAESWNPLTKVYNSIQVAGLGAKEQNLLETGITLAENQTSRTAALNQTISAYTAGTVIPALNAAKVKYAEINSNLQVEEISAALATMRGSDVITGRNRQQNLANAGSLSQEQRAIEANNRAKELHAINLESSRLALKAAKERDASVLNPSVSAYLTLAGLEDTAASRKLGESYVLKAAQSDPALYGILQRLGVSAEGSRQKGKPLTKQDMQTAVMGMDPMQAAKIFQATGAETFAGPLAQTSFAVRQNMVKAELAKVVQPGKSPTATQQKIAIANADAAISQMTAGQLIGRTVSDSLKQPNVIPNVSVLAEPVALGAVLKQMQQGGKLTPQETAVVQAPQFQTILASPIPTDAAAPLRRATDIMDYAIKHGGMDIGQAAHLAAKTMRERASAEVRSSSSLIETGAALGLDVTPKNVRAGYGLGQGFVADAGRAFIETGIKARDAIGLPIDPETVKQLQGLLGESVNIVNEEDLVLHYGRKQRAAKGE